MLKRHARFGDSSAAKVDFVITIESVDYMNVMKYPGHLVIEWSRSNQSGKTAKALIDDSGRAVWNHLVDFTSKMYMEKKGLSPKTIVFTAKYVKDNGKTKSIGKLSLNISEFVDFDKVTNTTRISRVISKEEKMQLRLSIKCVIIKMKLKNNKKLAINKDTGQWEEGADSEWSVSEMEGDPGERSGSSKSGRERTSRNKKDDSRDEDSDSLAEAIQHYSASISEENMAKKKDMENKKNTGKSGRDLDDPFVSHNENFLRRDQGREKDKPQHRKEKPSRERNQSSSDREDSENEEDCKCVLL